MLGGKSVKAGMKQQNLFGQTIVEDSSKGGGAKSKKKSAGKEKMKTDPKKKSESPLPDAGSAVVPQDAQMDDDSQVTLSFDSQVQEVETQLEETQLDGSSPVVDTEVETQPTTETQTEEEETQPETQVDEDDDEPVRRFYVGICLNGELKAGNWLFLSDCGLACHTATGDYCGDISSSGDL